MEISGAVVSTTDVDDNSMRRSSDISLDIEEIMASPDSEEIKAVTTKKTRDKVVNEAGIQSNKIFPISIIGEEEDGHRYMGAEIQRHTFSIIR